MWLVPKFQKYVKVLFVLNCWVPSPEEFIKPQTLTMASFKFPVITVYIVDRYVAHVCMTVIRQIFNETNQSSAIHNRRNKLKNCVFVFDIFICQRIKTSVILIPFFAFFGNIMSWRILINVPGNKFIIRKSILKRMHFIDHFAQHRNLRRKIFLPI